MPGFHIPQSAASCLDKDAFQERSTYTGPDPNMEYARRNRWMLEFLEPFGNVYDGILIYAHKCMRPTPEIDEIKIHHGQDEIYRPGKNRWNPVDFTFYEKSPGNPTFDEAAERIYKWWAETTIVLTESKHGELNDYLKNCNLRMLDGVGNKIWEYNLYECWPMKVSPCDLDYSDSNIAEITVTLRFNKAKETR